MIEKDFEKRKILQEHIDSKLKRGENNRLKKIEDSTKSLTNLRQRRLDMHSEKFSTQKK